MPAPDDHVWHRYAIVICFICAASIILVSPVAASLSLTGQSITPPPPLIVGQKVHAITTISIVPAGKTTFPWGHMLQMQTSLAHAQWNIQIFQNGVAAAQLSSSGSAAFVNGNLLSYWLGYDISFQVTIDGTVPVSPEPTVQVLQIEEIDNSGAVVPGSVISVTLVVANPQTATVTPVSLSSQIPSVAPVPATTKEASGFSAGSICVALIICIAVLKRL
jgi:hypothetical protein